MLIKQAEVGGFTFKESLHPGGEDLPWHFHDGATPVVFPVVKWMSYPTIGVEFENIDENNKELVFRFMFRAERKVVPLKRPKSVGDRFK